MSLSNDEASRGGFIPSLDDYQWLELPSVRFTAASKAPCSLRSFGPAGRANGTSQKPKLTFIRIQKMEAMVLGCVDAKNPNT